MVTSAEHWQKVFSSQKTSGLPDDDQVARDAANYFGDVEGRRLLDVGCGIGNYSVWFAKRGANVTAVDTSSRAIAALSEHLEEQRVKNVLAVQATAFEIRALGQFDFVFGSMILHHLEPFDRFSLVLRDVLKADGRAFFHENSANNPLLLWARRHIAGRYGVPKWGDEDEFPFEQREIDLLRKHFDVATEVRDLYLLRVASDYLLGRRLFELATRADRHLYRFSSLGKYSYRQYIKLHEKGHNGEARQGSASLRTGS